MEDETVFSNDPAAMAQKWAMAGAELIHVIDLDGAFKKSPQNIEAIKNILKTVDTPIQVGGGIRTERTIRMGFCHFKLKEHEKAIRAFKKVIQLDPSSAIDYANIASNYRQMGEKEKANRYYQMALTLDDTIQFAREHLQEQTV